MQDSRSSTGSISEQYWYRSIVAVNLKSLAGKRIKVMPSFSHSSIFIHKEKFQIYKCLIMSFFLFRLLAKIERKKVRLLRKKVRMIILQEQCTFEFEIGTELQFRRSALLLEICYILRNYCINKSQITWFCIADSQK